MAQNNSSLKVLTTFEIPDDLAKELSDLLIKQSIRERVLTNLIGDLERYEMAENMLMQTTSRIEVIKQMISREYVPEEFRSSQYIWNYSGYDIDGNKAYIVGSN